MRKNLTKEQIFNAANRIAATGVIPTLTKLQLALETGSKVTIHKYFKQWQATLVKKFSALHTTDELRSDSLGKSSLELKLELQSQIKQHAYYKEALINAEKLNLKLTEENQQLKVEIEKLQLETTAAKDWRLDLESIIQQIKAELNLNTNATIQNMQQTIDDLRLELKVLNETSIAALRDTSFQGHELLMQEKVTSINLQAKIDSLNQEQITKHKQFNEESMAMQMQIKLLARENAYLQKNLQKSLQANFGENFKAEKLTALELLEIDQLNLNLSSKKTIKDLIKNPNQEVIVYAK